MAEFEQLASDALVTPERVLPGQRQHQLLALGRERGRGAVRRRTDTPGGGREVRDRDWRLGGGEG